MNKKVSTIILRVISVLGFIGVTACFARSQYHQGRIDVRKEIDDAKDILAKDYHVKYELVKIEEA